MPMARRPWRRARPEPLPFRNRDPARPTIEVLLKRRYSSGGRAVRYDSSRSAALPSNLSNRAVVPPARRVDRNAISPGEKDLSKSLAKQELNRAKVSFKICRKMPDI